MNKKVSILFILLLFSFILPCSVYAAQTVSDTSQSVDVQEQSTIKVAILPVIGGSRYYKDVNAYIYNELLKSVHIPLNGVLNLMEYVDKDKTAAVAADLLSSGVDITKEEGLKQAADKLNADLVIGVKIDFIAQDIVHTFDEDNDPFLISRLGLQLFVYDSRTGQYNRLTNQQYYDDVYSPSGTVDALANDSMFYLLKKADVKQYIRK